MTVLELRLGAAASTVDFVLHEPTPTTASLLTRTRMSFSSATILNPTSFSVDLEDLFHGLGVLGEWGPTGTVFEWAPDLEALLRGNFDDVAVTNEVGRETGRPWDAPGTKVELNEPWVSDLRPFQQRDLSGLLAMRHGANFSVPGAGKTRVTLADFEARRQRGEIEQMVVVCPKSAYEAWTTEPLECYLPGEAPTVVVVSEGSLPAADIVLVNYERLPDRVGALVSHLLKKPTMMVLDEAHRMKLGSAGKWGQACYMLAPYAKSRLILTGTPAPNGAEDLSSLFGFVWPGVGRTNVEAALAGDSLREASRSLAPYYVRTTKRDLALPAATIEPRRVKFEGIHRQVYDALIDASRGRVGTGKDANVMNMTAMRLLMAADTPALLSLGVSQHDELDFKFERGELSRDASLDGLLRDLPELEFPPKYREALTILEENRRAGRKTIVWSSFVRNLTSLYKLFSDHDLGPAMVHGGTKDRAAELEKFRSDPDSWVLLSNPATLGEGVSLHQVCHEAIYLDRDYNAGRYLQSLDRIHRLGLAPDVTTRMVLLIAEDTVDEVVHERLESKIRFQLDILNDPYVEQLVDVDVAPAQSEGMDQVDIQALLQHLKSYGRRT